MSEVETIFVDAWDDAKVGISVGRGKWIGKASTPEMLADILKTHHITRSMLFRDGVFMSTMDFAREAGFAEDGDARKMFFDAVELL
tara:strand:- start:22 stop:279 length:258 start_codon:yes stop_codon:yes gene_type:complete